MLRVTVLAGLGLAVAHLAAGESSSSPFISARIQASWPAPALTTLYLESVAQENVESLFPFLAHLVTHPAVPSTIPALEVPLASFQGFNPVLTPLLRPNESFVILEQHLSRSGIFRRRGEPESLRLAVAMSESSVVVEGMRILAHEREMELGVEASEEDCDSWVDVAGQRACSIDAFWAIVGLQPADTSDALVLPASPTPALHSFDHLSPSTRDPSLPLVIFYADPTSFAFSPCFSFLYDLSTASPRPRLQFAIRWSAPRKANSDKLVLSGYGASLDIKKSDYLAIDDRLSSGAGGAVLKDTSERPKMVAVKKADITDLGLRATAYILSQPDPLSSFTHLTSSFPLLASQLSTLVPTPPADLSSELLENLMTSPFASSPSFSLNGIPLPLSSIDPYALLRLMRTERKFVTDIQRASLGRLSMKQSREILSGDEVAKAGKVGVAKDGRVGSEALGELFDAGDRKEGGGLVLWWNDLEKDKRYAKWSSQVTELLRPVYPGQMSQIGRNLNNVVLVLDLARPASLLLVTESVKAFVSRGIPVRFGLVPQVSAIDEADPSTAVASAMWYLVDMIGRSKTMAFLTTLASTGRDVTLDDVQSAYQQLAMQNSHPAGGPLASFDDVLHGPGSRLKLDQALQYTRRLGVALPTTPSATCGAFFLNGAYFVVDDDFTQNLQRTLTLHNQFLQQEVYQNHLLDEADANTYFYDLATTYGRRNAFIFPVPETNPLRVVNLVDLTAAGSLADFKQFHDSYIEAVTPVEDDSDDEGVPVVATIYVVTDLDTPHGRSLAKASLDLLESHTQTRISLIHNPSPSSPAPHAYSLSAFLSLLIEADVLMDVLPKEILAWLDLDITPAGPGSLRWMSDNPVLPFTISGAGEGELSKSVAHWDKLRPVVEKFGIKRGENAVVVNGRVVGPFEDNAFTLEDLDALLEYELTKRIMPVVKSMEAAGFDPKLVSQAELPRLYMLTTSVVSEAYLPDTSAGLFAAGTVERSTGYRLLSGNHSSYIGPNEEDAPFELGIVVDPLSVLAQKWAPIIETLSSHASVHLRLYLNPALQLSELPLKRFYAFSFPAAPTFSPETGLELAPTVDFVDIPEDTLLTFGTDLPRAWLAFPRSSVHDLDNIRLADLAPSAREEGVQATFELEAIIVEGHARDVPSGSPPRGLQLELAGGATTVDSLVMSNLGYFQLKANPGLWRLGIREGRSSEVYEMESVGAEGWKSAGAEEKGDRLAVTTLEGLTIYPRFRRRKGMEMAELLEDGASQSAKDKKSGGTVVDRVQNMFPFLAPYLSPKAADEAIIPVSKKANINIFTVASGLLYERMAFLMMVSVMRHTKSTVKFWFIQNFLSPSFTAFIPHMAAEYGFEYELVTYKWPHWLRAQTEKQRTIWGYKILFLDVLFPLELDRVIFVDSDQVRPSGIHAFLYRYSPPDRSQIVRADLQELVDLDLHGAPYAYAPMGSDREETAGFRFWDSGYWKEHLRGRPYHISALYVVDLDRFRQVAAGDRLRQQYQGLSADPNSLSNLDQDLPNNMQAQIPIYTLDQSWLWCETWCSDESLAQAKTIDLCNNPLTHEPKLARAKRLIPEWTVYDDEVAALAARIAASQPASSLSSGAQSGINAFSKKADELVQAVEQSAERDEFVHEAVEKERDAHGGEDEKEGRVKDEL
ncbi:hypothetical protein RQP46_007868 [Phenoliferia psychrophenolica]